jgi:hypothetical protein
MRIGTVRVEEAKVFDSKAGFHQFINEDGEEYGSFEVFWSDDTEDSGAGWYWHACFPGCMPDGDPFGPFARSSQAYDEARDE